MKKLRMGVGWLSGMALTGVILAAYLESDDSDLNSRNEPEGRSHPCHPEIAEENPVTQLIRRVAVGSPWSYRNLTVFPLILRTPERMPEIRTLDEALDRKWITVREKECARVSRLDVRNLSTYCIFFMAGEILAGGKQNRMVRDDVLLPPDSGWLEVPVYCSEQRRWSDSLFPFTATGYLAHPELRRGATSGADQATIWREIEKRSARHRMVSPTRDYRQLYRDPAVSREMEDYARHFLRLPTASIVGIVAASGRQIVGCDFFSDPRLFAELWNKLLRSYALEVIHRGRPEGDTRVDDVRRFLDHALNARYERQDTPGLGRLYAIRGAVEGSALVWEAAPVHVSLFGQVVRPVPRPPPTPWPVPPPCPWPPIPFPMESVEQR